MKAVCRSSHLGCVALVGSLLLSGISCSRSGGPPLYPVEGKVLVGGQPAAGAIVALHRQPALPGIPPGAAEAAADGAFRPMTFQAADGLPEGEYRISVVWLQAAPQVSAIKGMASDEATSDPIDRLQGRYRDPNTSNLKYTVKAGHNEPLTLELK